VYLVGVHWNYLEIFLINFVHLMIEEAEFGKTDVTLLR
jgi:hypothetical protein